MKSLQVMDFFEKYQRISKMERRGKTINDKTYKQ